jgi:hypothetical protein
VILGAAVVGILAAGACSEQAAAVRVEGRTVSQAEFMDEVEDLYEWINDEPADGSYDQQFVGNVATERAVYLLLRDMYEDSGRSLVDEDMDGACAAVLQAPEVRPGMCEAMLFELGGMAEPPDWYVDQAIASMGPEIQPQLVVENPAPLWYREQLVEQVVMNTALNNEYGPGYLQAALADADIEVSSRFGSWDSALLENPNAASAVVPPDGPLVQRDGDEPDPGAFDLGDLDIDDLMIEEAPAGP